MSQLVIIILPAPASLDTLRACLTRRFTLNPKVEGLGDVEELHTSDESGRTTIFSKVPGPISEDLCHSMRKRGLAPERFSLFFAEYGWGIPESAILEVAESLHGWLFDTWGRLLSPAEFRAKSNSDRPPSPKCG